MQVFYDTISIAGGIAVVIGAAVLLLPLLVRTLDSFTSRDHSGSFKDIEFDGILGDVILENDKKFSNVKISIADPQSAKDERRFSPFPDTIILEEPDGQRILLKPQSIKMIVVPPAQKK